MLEDNARRRIQMADMEILRAFDEVCRKNDVRYFAVCGTLLGAVRHGGFIPWDDDLDFGILREDFEKLKRLPKEAWGDKIEFVTAADDDVRHDKVFPRVYLKGSKIQSYDDVENWIDPATGKAWYTSLPLDLFIFDEIPDDDGEYVKLLHYCRRLRKGYKGCRLEANYKTAHGFHRVKRFYRYWNGKLSRAIWKRPWKRLDDRMSAAIAASGKGSDVGCYYSWFGGYGGYDTYRIPKQNLFPIGTVRFEDMLIPAPNNIHEILAKDYGDDYMQPPPEENRGHVDFIYADLADGTVLNIDPIPGSLGAELAGKQGQEKS